MPVGFMPTKPVFQVNSTELYWHTAPAMAALADGTYVVAWDSANRDDSNNAIVGQRFSAAGDALGDEFVVNTTTLGPQKQASVAGLDDGGFIVTWTDGLTSGKGKGVFGQKFDSDGTMVGAEIVLSDPVTKPQQSSQVTALADGEFIVTWQENRDKDGDSFGVFARHFNSDGSAKGAAFQVNTYWENQQSAPDITALDTGGYVVTWMSHGQDGDSGGIFGQRFDDSDTKVGTEFQINTETDQLQGSAKVVGLSHGGFIVVYRSDAAGGILAQRFDYQGSKVGAETQINTNDTEQQFDPQVTALADGGYVVAWMSLYQDGDGGGIYAARFDALGDPVGGEQLINTHTEDNQKSPVVEALPDGGFVISWESDETQPRLLYEHIFARQFAPQIYGTKAANTIYDTFKANWIDGRGGNDLLLGQDGDDTLLGRGGADILKGGEGDDRLSGGGGKDSLFGGTGEDWLKGDKGNDKLRGGDNDDLLEGGAGNDKLWGEAGDDRLKGGAGKDTLWGKAGSDTLDGGNGADTLWGGAGVDKFVFRNGYDTDTVKDFESGTDILRLDNNLWGGQMTKQIVVLNFASVNGDDIVFDFGSGDRLTLQGFTDMGALADDITII